MSKDNIIEFDDSVLRSEEPIELQVNPAELEAAKQEAAKVNDPEHYTHTFKKPFERDGKTYPSLEFDFSQLTGVDMLAVENELHARGQALIMPTFNGEFLYMLAARACGIGSDVLVHVPAADFNKITGKVRSFLLLTES